MNSIALARKYRPRTFSELIGQNHVTKALANSLTRNRLHHAYLFTGTRGVGKTSVARLLAKALNCEQGMGKDPCLNCDACIAIEEGRYIDLIEIDAASKTRVEDTRELLENVSYAPTNGRFKVYLIDEVHMLSTHSFNALLKTLEEPPEHVIFLLATTEVQKLPMTVLSRCLQFHLNALTPDTIQKQLELILNQENITFDDEALTLIAKAADGSMRDSLSLLDQMIALSDDRIETDSVKEALGHTKHNHVLDILNALASQNPEQLIHTSHAIAKEGGQYAYVLDELLSNLHQLSLLYVLPQAKHPLTTLCQSIKAEDAQLFYQIAQKGKAELTLAPTRAIGFEMTLLRMHAFKPVGKAATPALAYEAKPNTPKIKTPPAPKAEKPKPKARPTENGWSTLIPKLKLTGLALNAAKQSELKLQENGSASLHFDKNHRSLFTPGVLKKIEEELSKHYGQTIKINLQSDDQTPNTPAKKEQVQDQIKQAEHQAKLDADNAFQALKETFASE